MTIEGGLAMGATVVLAMTIGVQGLFLFGKRRRPGRIALGLRTIATLLLAGALLAAIARDGGWMPLDLQQAALGLGLATAVAATALRWWAGVDGTELVADLAVLALTLFSMVVWPGPALLTCAQRQLPFWFQWGFFLLGTSATIIAASASLMPGLWAWLEALGVTAQLSPRADLGDFKGLAVALALLFLGSGLVTSGCWAWRSTGSLLSGDPRISWMAAAWLMMASNRVARQFGTRNGLWAASLTVIAAVIGSLGFLAVSDLVRFFGN